MGQARHTPKWRHFSGKKRSFEAVDLRIWGVLWRTCPLGSNFWWCSRCSREWTATPNTVRTHRFFLHVFSCLLNQIDLAISGLEPSTDKHEASHATVQCQGLNVPFVRITQLQMGWSFISAADVTKIHMTPVPQMHPVFEIPPGQVFTFFLPDLKVIFSGHSPLLEDQKKLLDTYIN